MRVAVRADASPLIGSGHVMRCLTLADALAANGAQVTFVAANMTEPLEKRIREGGHQFARIPASAEMERQGTNWHEPPLGEQAQLEDVGATGSACGSVDWLIVDHYLLDGRWHSAARGFAEKLLVIDDLANRQYDCDLLLDQNLGRLPVDYASLVPAGTRVLAGAAYALLRPEFGRERPAALERRKSGCAVRRILISTGSTDPQGIAAAVLQEIMQAVPLMEIDIVLGRGAESLALVHAMAAEHPNIRVHVDSSHMAELMREADLAVGAAGTTSWERCCLGLPAIALVLADNQRPSAVALADAGAVVTVESAAELGPALEQLLGEPDRLGEMSAAAFAITDSGGVDRVAASICGGSNIRRRTVELRPATALDAETLWLWRNDVASRAQSRNTAPISWRTHMAWLRGAVADRQRQIMIAEISGEPIGQIAFHRENGETEVSIVVAAAERGSGIGRLMLTAACREHAADTIYATVRVDNAASRRLFEACAFTRVESGEVGFVRYMRTRENAQRKQA